jgi:hypothetical protein
MGVTVLPASTYIYHLSYICRYISSSRSEQQLNRCTYTYPISSQFDLALQCQRWKTHHFVLSIEVGSSLITNLYNSKKDEPSVHCLFSHCSFRIVQCPCKFLHNAGLVWVKQVVAYCTGQQPQVLQRCNTDFLYVISHE